MMVVFIEQPLALSLGLGGSEPQITDLVKANLFITSQPILTEDYQSCLCSIYFFDFEIK